MSVQLVVDMSLSVEWVAELAKHGWSAVHWSAVGDPRANDSVIMAWALANGHVVFTHDLDFGTMLALTHATGPSVLQVRGQDVLPEDIGPVVIAALAALLGLVLFLPILWRTAQEDRFLREQLEGYADYAQKVRYRLFPGVW